MRLLALPAAGLLVLALTAQGGGGGAGAPGPDDPCPTAYPGDGADKARIARWMARGAALRGLPDELPAMAALAETGVANIRSPDRRYVGFFQMDVKLWNTRRLPRLPAQPRAAAALVHRLRGARAPAEDRRGRRDLRPRRRPLGPLGRHRREPRRAGRQPLRAPARGGAGARGRRLPADRRRRPTPPRPPCASPPAAASRAASACAPAARPRTAWRRRAATTAAGTARGRSARAAADAPARRRPSCVKPRGRGPAPLRVQVTAVDEAGNATSAAAQGRVHALSRRRPLGTRSACYHRRPWPDTGLPEQDAQDDFNRVRRRRALARLSARLRREPGDVNVILPFEEVVAALGRRGERRLGRGDDRARLDRRHRRPRARVRPPVPPHLRPRAHALGARRAGPAHRQGDAADRRLPHRRAALRQGRPPPRLGRPRARRSRDRRAASPRC